MNKSSNPFNYKNERDGIKTALISSCQRFATVARALVHPNTGHKTGLCLRVFGGEYKVPWPEWF